MIDRLVPDRFIVVCALSLLACGGAPPPPAPPAPALPEDPQASLARARALRDGEEGNLGRDRSVALFDRACEAAIADACLERARLYSDPALLPLDRARELALLDRACELGNAEACATAAGIAPDGEPYLSRARTLLTNACQSGRAAACMSLVDLLGEPEQEQRRVLWAQAAPLFAVDCDAHDADACYQLSRLRMIGGDPESAYALASQACDLGEPLGCMFSNPHRDDRARELRTESSSRACDRGVAEQCTLLERFYARGPQAAAARARAQQLLQEACDAGRIAACTELASLIFGNDSDRATALRHRACDAGDGRACADEAEMLEADDEVTPAVALWEQACALHYPASCERGASLREWIDRGARDPGVAGARAAAIARAIREGRRDATGGRVEVVYLDTGCIDSGAERSECTHTRRAANYSMTQDEAIVAERWLCDGTVCTPQYPTYSEQFSRGHSQVVLTAIELSDTTEHAHAVRLHVSLE